MERQTQRTYALTAVTFQRHRIFQKASNAELLIGTILRHRAHGRFLLHAFVIMPDHFHALLTPTESIEKTAQLVKGGLSFAIRNTHSGPVWQESFHEHRVRDLQDYEHQLRYILNNPARRNDTEYPHIHTNYPADLDPPPNRLLPE